MCDPMIQRIHFLMKESFEQDMKAQAGRRELPAHKMEVNPYSSYHTFTIYTYYLCLSFFLFNNIWISYSLITSESRSECLCMHMCVVYM